MSPGMLLVGTGSPAAGDTWHICLEGLKDVGTLCYGWRAEADAAWGGGSRFHPGGTEHTSPSFPGALLLRQLSGGQTPDCVSVRPGTACMCPRQQIILTGPQHFLPHSVPCTPCASSQESGEALQPSLPASVVWGAWVQGHGRPGMGACRAAGQVMLDPYCPGVSQVTVPDNVNLVPPRGGAAGSMPRNTPEVRCPPPQVTGCGSAPLSSLCCLRSMPMASTRHGGSPRAARRAARAAACTPLLS